MGRCSGDALVDGDADYDGARAVWNAMIDRRPAVIVRCRGTADVVAAVHFARAHGCRSRSGRRPQRRRPRGLRRRPDDRSVADARRAGRSERRRAWVEGGATWRDVDRETQAFGLATPGGLISDTGVAGLTLSGGIGWLRSRHGLCIDNLVGGRRRHRRRPPGPRQRRRERRPAVGAQGRRRQFRRRHGVRVRPPSRRADADVLRPALSRSSAGSGPIRFWRDFLADKNDDVGSLVEFSTIPRDPAYPERYWGERVYTIASVYAGDADEGERLLQPLRELGELVADFSGQMGYCDIQQLFDTLIPFGQYRCYWKSHYLSGLATR